MKMRDTKRAFRKMERGEPISRQEMRLIQAFWLRHSRMMGEAVVAVRCSTVAFIAEIGKTTESLRFLENLRLSAAQEPAMCFESSRPLGAEDWKALDKAEMQATVEEMASRSRKGPSKEA